MSFPPEQDFQRVQLLLCYLQTQQWATATSWLTKMSERPEALHSHLTPLLDALISSSNNPELHAALDRLLEKIADALRSKSRLRELIDLYSRLARYTEAIRVCDEVIQNAGDHPSAEALYLRGEMRRANLNQYAAAITDFEQAIQIQPNFIEAHISLARTLSALARPRDAISALQNAISRRSEPTAVLWLELGRLADANADYELAEQAFEQAIQIEPKNASQLNSIAWILVTRTDEAMRDSTRSIELIRRALEISPERVNGPAWNTLGVAMYFAGKYDEAIAALEKSVSLNPEKKPSHFDALFLAMAHWQLGMRELSREYLNVFDDLRPLPDPSSVKVLRFRDEARALIEASETKPRISTLEPIPR